MRSDPRSGPDLWQEDFGVWRFRLGHAVLQISKAPADCEEGRWLGHALHVPRHSDRPFYYMDLGRAKDEMLEWLLWRSGITLTVP
jgi:hypothetical protein